MSYKNQFTCLRFSLVLFFLLFCLFSFAQSKKVVEIDHRFDAVEQLFKQNVKQLGNNFAAVVWQDGKVLYERHGSDDFLTKTAAPIVRSADWMIAALVMTFVDEGKLSLDDKVTQYIPMFGKYMKGYITIRNCLTNTTGIKTDENIRKAMEKIHAESLEEEVNSYASHKDIGTNPGTEFFFSSLGPNIAARVLEVVGKKPVERLMIERISRPLKMRGTDFSSQDGGASNPSGGAMSSANDYIAFLAMLLNKGMGPDKRVLSEKAVAELETPQFTSLPVKFMPKEVQGASFGLGNYITGTGNNVVWFCPNMLGTYAYIDKCRNYAAILIVQKPTEEDKKVLGQTMMNLINEQLSCTGN